MNRSYIAGCAVALLLSAGCSQTPRKAPADTRAADEKTIRDGEVAWSNDWASKDVRKIEDHYADDAALMIPGAPLMKGTDAIDAGLRKLLEDKNLSLSFTTTYAEVAKSDDIAYTQGTYTMTQTDPRTSKPITEQGKYVTVYKKQADGSWKAVEDISNADAPLPAATPVKESRKPAQRRAKNPRRRRV